MTKETTEFVCEQPGPEEQKFLEKVDKGEVPMGWMQRDWVNHPVDMCVWVEVNREIVKRLESEDGLLEQRDRFPNRTTFIK